MARILFVVHRFGASGGSEYNVLRYAKACKSLGHNVAVLTDDNPNLVIDIPTYKHIEDFIDPDLIVVHGDGNTQNKIHMGTVKYSAPVLYLLIRPDPFLEAVKAGLNKATWIGCATSADMRFVQERGFENKIRRVQYPIDCPEISSASRDKFGITEQKVYLSCGGYWPHKGFEELVAAFIDTRPQNTELILTGYDTRHGMPNFTKLGQDNGVKIQMFLTENVHNVYELMTLSDMYIWNSKPGTEGYGLVLLESMFYGCPWIGTDTAAASDLKGIGGTTYVGYDALKSLLKCPLNKDSFHAKDFVIKYHNPEVAAKTILSVLEQ